MNDFEDTLLRRQSDPLNEDLQEKFIAGECTLSERVAVERWIKFNGKHGIALEAMRADGKLEHLAGRPSNEAVLLSYDIIQNAAEPATVATAYHSVAEIGLLDRTRLQLIAAAFSVMAVLIVGYLSQPWNDKIKSSKIVYLYSTGAGEIARVNLPDGSKVVLAPQSKLTVSGNYNSKQRKVNLRGEAQFDILNSTSVPFLVEADNTVTKVIGTVFSVRRYPEDSATAVSVLTGKVAVGTGNRNDGVISKTNPSQAPSLVLSAGMIGTIGNSYANARVVSDVSRRMDWANGSIVFRDTPIPEVLEKLGLWYGLKFELTDSTLLSHTLSDELNFISSAQLIRAIEILLDVDAEVFAGGKVVRLNARYERNDNSPIK